MAETTKGSSPNNTYTYVLPQQEDQPPAYESLPAVVPRDTEVHSYTTPQVRNAISPALPAYADQECTETVEYCGPDVVVERYVNNEGARLDTPYCTLAAGEGSSHLYAQRQQENEYELHEYEYPNCAPPAVPSTDGRRQVRKETPPNNQEVVSPPTPREDKPRTWLPWSIVTLVLLCLPLGIPATILSAFAESDYKKGKVAAAKRKAKAAFVLNIIGTVCGGIVIFTILGGVAFVLGVCAYCSAASSNSS